MVGEPIPLDPPTVMSPLTEWFNNNSFVVPYHTLDIMIEKGFRRQCSVSADPIFRVKLNVVP